MLEMAVQRGANKVYIHASLDGRDCPPRSAKPSLEKTQALCDKLGTGKIATIIGRFFSMDRDNRWDRVEQAYRLMTEGHANHTAATAVEGLEAAYSRDENDEFVQATAIVAPGETAVAIEDGDAIISMNFRPDRAREITHALVDEQFDGFERHKVVNLSSFVMTTEYEATLDLPCAYPPENLVNSLGEFLANQGKQQLRIAETEKYAHVTFFFSGGREALYDGEERTLIPSPDVETYDQKPEMSAFEVTEKLVEAIDSGRFDTIICNYANCDQVGHTGNFDASVKAVETIDTCLQRVIEAAAKQDGEVLITADHGNVEEMFDEASNQPHTQHTTLPVPLVYAGPRQISLDSGGSLADIAPTILDMMGLEKPAEMSGRSLII
jgi:2,3-bisphosphoglycerate-independent phosphoglycerate mutase